MSKAINIENLRQFAQEFWTKIKGRLATVATTGSYNDLSNKPTIVNPGTLNTNNTTAQTASASESFSGTIALHKVSKTGNYNDLLNKPTIPQGTVTGIKMNGESKGTSGVVDLGTVLTSKPSYTASEVGALPTGTTLDNIADGSTRKLSNYATQASLNSHTGDTTVHITSTERSNWNNKVSNVQADWNATSGLAQILNKPTIPTVNNATLTVKQNGSSVGTFTANAASNVTIDLGTVLTSHQDITDKENTSNKVVSITSSSTDSQYPSSKAVYNAIEGAKSYADSAVANIDNETWTFELENGSTVTRTVLLA